MSSSRSADTRLPPARVHEVSDGIYAYVQPNGSWWINNAGFLVGPQGVASVDACATERRTRAYLDAIAAVTPLPVRTLINTHHHGDHTFGNALFSNAAIVAHEQTRPAMVAWGPPRSAPYWTEVGWGAVSLDPPFITYSDGLTLWSGELPCEVRHVGTAAHTTNDSIVWIPERRVLFAGDLLFNGGTPFVVQGSVAGTIQVLEHVIRPLKAEVIVPGHGEVSGPEVIDAVLGYLRFVQRTARGGKAAGLSPLDAAREADLGSYSGLLDAERLVGNLHRAYAELDGAAPGAPLDINAALADMVAYNGGRPLSCMA